MNTETKFTGDVLSVIYDYLENAPLDEIPMLRKVRKHFTETINRLERKEKLTAVLSELAEGRVGVPATIAELEKIK